MSQSGPIKIQGGSGGGGVPINPLKIISDFDDFLSTSNGNNNVGNLLWQTQNYNFASGSTDHPGYISYPLTPGLPSFLMLANLLSNTDTADFVLGGGEYSQNFVTKLNALSNGVDTYNIFIGLLEWNSSGLTPVFPPNNGVYFTYTDSVNSGNWQIVTNSSTITTVVNTNVVADTNYHNFGIVVNSNATIVTFSIDGVTVGTISTNIPTTQISPVIYHNPTSGSPLAFDVDLFYYLLILTNARPGTQGVWPGSGGNGNVIGPVLSTDKAVVRFNGTTGKIIENSVAILSDSGVLTGLTGLSVTGPTTLNGAQIVKRTTTAINYNVLITDYYIGVTSTAAPRSIVLPVTGATTGQIFTVKDESGGAGTNNITVTVEGGALIDGAASQVINGNYQDDSFIFNGTNYFTY